MTHYEKLLLDSLRNEVFSLIEKRLKKKYSDYSLSATATRAELHRKHPRGKDQSVRKSFNLIVDNDDNL